MNQHDWPPLLLGVVLCTYWARVVRMAVKARRRPEGGANFIPGEAFGRMTRVVWIPLVMVWVAHPFCLVLLRSPPWALVPYSRNVFVGYAGAALALAALFGSMVCWKQMGRSWRMGINLAERTPLITGGPYAYVRHPIYALSALLMIASVIVLPSPLMIAMAIAHLMFLQWEARREERHLLAVHGKTYDDYRSRVGRLLPRSRASGRRRAG